MSQYYSEEEDDSELNTTRSNADSCYYEDEGNEYKGIYTLYLNSPLIQITNRECGKKNHLLNEFNHRDDLQFRAIGHF